MSPGLPDVVAGGVGLVDIEPDHVVPVDGRLGQVNPAAVVECMQQAFVERVECPFVPDTFGPLPE